MMSPYQALTPTERPTYRTLTDKRACITLKKHGVDFTFLDIKHVKLFAVASPKVRKHLVGEWKSIIRATCEAARLAYPGNPALSKRLVFRACEAKYVDKELKGSQAMVAGFSQAMVDALIALKLGSDTPASNTSSGQFAEGESDVMKEPDLDWSEFITEEVRNEWDLE